MTIPDHVKALEVTAMKIFEEAAFALIDDNHEEREKHAQIAAKVRFQGPQTGTLYARIDVALSVMFAENMLGVDPGDPDAENKGFDAMKELLNMVCGNLLPKIYGNEKEFRIDPPVDINIDEYMSALSNSDCPESLIIVEGYESNLLLVEDAF